MPDTVTGWTIYTEMSHNVATAVIEILVCRYASFDNVVVNDPVLPNYDGCNNFKLVAPSILEVAKCVFLPQWNPLYIA